MIYIYIMSVNLEPSDAHRIIDELSEFYTPDIYNITYDRRHGFALNRLTKSSSIYLFFTNDTLIIFDAYKKMFIITNNFFNLSWRSN